MNGQELATLLFALRVIAVVLLIAAISKQVKQLRTTTTEYPGVRIAVFVATVVLLIGQITPIILDSLVAFGPSYPGRSNNPNLIATSYTLNNAGKDVVIGALLAFQYYRPRRKK